MTLRESWTETLQLVQLRAAVRSPRYRRLWALVAVTYVLISMLISQMLLFYPGPSTITGVQVMVFTSPEQVANPYLLPGMIVLAPNVVLSIALWPTVVMVVLGIGIGLSVAAAVATLVAERQRRPDVAAGGVAPVVTGWALLGACCCTGCAAQVAAVGAVGVLVGSSPSDLLATSWPLGALQLVIVGMSLLYMERRLSGPAPACDVVRTPVRRQIVALVLRVALLIGSITWLFAFVIELSETPTADVTPALLYHWTFEHLILCAVGILSAMAPELLWGWTLRLGRRSYVWRVPAVVAGVSWAVWVPPVIAAWGLGGTLNELFGFLALPAGFGGVTPDADLGFPLYFHWAFQHLVLGLWAVAAAVLPNRAFALVSPGLRPTIGGRNDRPPARASVPVVALDAAASDARA